ncbi:cytochrome P450 [Heliocybe sulcata]|uniref:Cytochrome P450 n=1 Tax=Heliocybe sulcata TaxID=5364 RepID=A0A5C3MUM8_9AGAM|nr:cytochrome P450 [Heliocybe sulcata]
MLNSCGLSTPLLASAVLLFYILWSYISTIYFSPLSAFPGPRLAATTIWWQVLQKKRGSMSKTLRDLHMKTGQTIFRVAPNQLSFWDPDAYREIYINQKFLKEPDFYGAFSLPLNTRSTFGHYKPELYTPLRRQAFTLFSRQSMVSLEPLFHEKLNIFVTRLPSGKEVNLFDAFRCLTMDTATQFSFGTSSECLQAEDFKAPATSVYDEYASGLCFRLYFPMFIWFLEYLPRWMKPYWQRGYSDLKQSAIVALERYRTGSRDHKYPVLFAYHFETNSPLTDDELCCEGATYIGAGGDTAGITLSVGCSYLARNPTVQEKLVQELQTAYPIRNDVLTAHWSDLEKLPYLSACVYESLRISVPVAGDLPRVVGPRGWNFKGVAIPPGTIVGCSATAVHLDSSIFPEPEVFKPERWIEEDGSISKTLESWLVSFSKGPRSCIGQTMAMAQLYIYFAAFVRLYRAEPAHKDQPVVLYDFFTTIPEDGCCNVVLTPREH